MLKICTSCKKEKPKNKLNFYPRKIKQYNKKGELVIYNSFKSNCIPCFRINNK